jgi:SAM-dependent methyltransferase
MAKFVLNLGAGALQDSVLPHYYQGWNHVRLDVDSRHAPDIVLDARELQSLEPSTFDAIYCSHNLEHYHRHEGVKVLRGMLHVLKPDGFAEIRVPDLSVVLRHMIEHNRDIDDVLYVAPRTPPVPILYRDVLYGYHVEIEQSGNDFFAHRTGFTPRSLERFFHDNGFPYAAMANVNLELLGYFFRQAPTPEQYELLSLRSRS